MWKDGTKEPRKREARPGPPLYVSRGIGTTFLPVRLGSTPEIAVFD